MNSEEKELEILENIYKSSTPIRQRDLAEVVGLSLGMTNSILKRLVNKGFLKIKKVNNRNIRYVVSAAGIEAISKKSYRYFKRTIKNVVFYKEAIDQLIAEGKLQGFDGVYLKGKSDLDFIVEHSCRKQGVEFVLNPGEFGGKAYTLYAENIQPEKEPSDGSAYLQELLIAAR